MRFRGFLWNNLVRVNRDHNYACSLSKPTCDCDLLVRLSVADSPLYSRSYSTGTQSQLDSNFSKIMRKLKVIEAKHACLQEYLNQLDVSHAAEYRSACKELGRLRCSVDFINELRTKEKEIDDLKSLIAESKEDRGLLDMATEEMDCLIKDKARVQNLLLKSLLPKDEADERDGILEVRAGVGGEEASLFAMEIFRMYEKYSQMKRWKFEILSLSSEKGNRGAKEAIGSISGGDVFGKLKFESGIHRVQRVPITEKGGRIHTSTVSVAILPQAEAIDIQLRNQDLKIDTYRSSGCGGQHVNTTDSAVRVTHLPTGITAAIQDERSQHQNKAKALKVVSARLYERERSKLQAERSQLRSEQVGRGERCERIRSYNFPQNRVTDHRIGITHHSVNGVLQGEGLDVFIDALLSKQEMDELGSFINEN